MSQVLPNQAQNQTSSDASTSRLQSAFLRLKGFILFCKPAVLFVWSIILFILVKPFQLLKQKGGLDEMIRNLVVRQQKLDQVSARFHKRRFQKPFDTIKLEQSELGFTNKVLFQRQKKTIIFYVPVYITGKIKSIQEIEATNLCGDVACAIIINIYYGDLPRQIVIKLKDSILVQLNRGDSFKLAHNEQTINLKQKFDNKFLSFTVRKVFKTALLEDPLWTPFNIVELILSFTLNTVRLNRVSPKQDLQKSDDGQKQKQKNQVEMMAVDKENPEDSYQLKFNCMRNNEKTPVSYSLDCVYGIYDLAEKRIQSYHTNVGTFNELQNASHKSEKPKQINNKQTDKHQVNLKAKGQKSNLQTNPKNDQSQIVGLRIRQPQKSKKHKEEKDGSVKYFQYTHFVIPLYKYPGNMLATIFLPIFLLALISLAIFFQEYQLSGRIASIATMILGYIGLIPTIKDKLPPSSMFTHIEKVIYIETSCCLLCLLQTFRMSYSQNYDFNWSTNVCFLLCLFVHIGMFLFVVGVFFIHVNYWEPSYNLQTKVKQVSPSQNRLAWDNPLCDQVFLKQNDRINSNQHYDQKKKEQLLIREFVRRNQNQQQAHLQKVSSQPLYNTAPVIKKATPRSEELTQKSS